MSLPKEKFDLLVSSLKDHQDRLPTFAVQHGIFLSVVVGWLVTSDQAHQLVSQSLLIRTIGTGALAVLTFLHGFWLRKQYQRSQDIKTLLDSLAYMEPQYYKNMVIPRYLPNTLTGLHALLTVFAISLLWIIK